MRVAGMRRSHELFDISRVPEARTLSVVERCRQGLELDCVRKLLDEVAAFMQVTGTRRAGPAFMRVLAQGIEHSELEVGYVVSDALQWNDRVRPGTIRGCTAIVTEYCGRLKMLRESADTCRNWIVAHGHHVSALPVEFFDVDPAECGDASNLKSRVVWPIEWPHDVEPNNRFALF